MQGMVRIFCYFLGRNRCETFVCALGPSCACPVLFLRLRVGVHMLWVVLLIFNFIWRRCAIQFVNKTMKGILGI